MMERTRQDHFAIGEGTVIIQWPASLSPESFEDVSAWLDILKRKMGRTVVKENDATENEDPQVEISELLGQLQALADNEWTLRPSRERSDGDDGEYAVWWYVIDRHGKSLGHPLGTPQAAIEAAMATKPENE